MKNITTTIGWFGDAPCWSIGGTAEQAEELEMATLQIIIDDIEYTTGDDDQEAASLLRLAGRDPKTYDLFLVDKRGIETRIKDKKIVDLHSKERFRTRRNLHFSVDGQSFASWDEDQTAAAVLRLAGIDQTGYDLARVNGLNGPETFTGDQLVTISDGDEFVTAKRTGSVA